MMILFVLAGLVLLAGSKMSFRGNSKVAGAGVCENIGVIIAWLTFVELRLKPGSMAVFRRIPLFTSEERACYV